MERRLAPIDGSWRARGGLEYRTEFQRFRGSKIEVDRQFRPESRDLVKRKRGRTLEEEYLQDIPKQPS